MGRKKKRAPPPSRIKYEKTHPTLTCRISPDIRERLDKSRKIDGKSFTDILKAGLGIVEEQDNKLAALIKKIEDKEYKLGYKEGYTDAKQRYRLAFVCSKCGGIIEVTSKEKKTALGQYIIQQMWCHKKCPRKKRTSKSTQKI